MVSRISVIASGVLAGGVDGSSTESAISLCSLPSPTHRIAARTERHASVDRGTTLGLRFD
jgi:hypothetical protein